MSAFLFLIPLGAVVLSTSMSLVEDNDGFVVSTKMADENLLKEALKNYASAIDNKSSLVDQLEKGIISFRKNEELGNYEAVFSESISNDDAINFISDLTNEYNLLVQNNVYTNIVNNLDNNNLSLESEEVLEDNSIVLTLNVND